MTNRFAALILLFTCASAVGEERPEICADWKSSIEEDHRILEADLTADAAKKAIALLEVRKEKVAAGKEQFAVLNAAKVLEGYALKQANLAITNSETKLKFCSWLTTEGFWYD